MRTRLLLVSLFSTSSLLVTAAPALAVGVVDQQQLDISGEISASMSQYVGQTFTAGMTGTLDSVALYPSAGDPITGLSVEIRTVARGLPTNNVVASQTVDSTVSGDWVTTTFTYPTRVVAGTRYAITVKMPTLYTVINLNGTGWGSNPYAGGTAVVGHSRSRLDLAFITYVSPPSPNQPDGLIAKGSHRLIGNDVYTADGSLQTRFASPGIGDRVAFRIAVQNDGIVPDSYTVQSFGSEPFYSVRYYRHTTEITDAVVGGTFTTPVLAPGEKYVIRVWVKAFSPAGAPNVSRLVTLTSVGDPAKVDAVQLVVEPHS